MPDAPRASMSVQDLKPDDAVFSRKGSNYPLISSAVHINNNLLPQIHSLIYFGIS